MSEAIKMTEGKNKFGNLIKQVRTENKTSQVQLAKQMGWSGNNIVSEIESNNYVPSYPKIMELMTELNIDHKHEQLEFLHLSFIEKLSVDNKRHLQAINDLRKECHNEENFPPQLIKIIDLLADASHDDYELIHSLLNRMI